MSKRGNPNPSPSTRFGAKNGNPINLAGKTRAQREAEYKAAEISAIMRMEALVAIQERVRSGELDILSVVEPNSLKLFRDSEDRAHGTPKASTDLTNSDGSLRQTIDPKKLTLEQRKAILAAQVTNEPDADAG